VPKLVCAPVAGSERSTPETKKDPQLVGDVNEVNLNINNNTTTALLDTGSCVSIISETFYKEHLADTELEPLTEMINIECADGQQLPYLGCIEATISIENGLEKATSKQCLFLISPDTKYSARTPIILGTNILKTLLQDCKDNFGEQFLQKANLHTPWFLSFRCLVIREKALRRNKNCLAILRCATEQKITIGPNQTKHIPVTAYRKLPYSECNALISEIGDSSLPDFIDIGPALVNYDFKKNEYVVELSNVTYNTVTIAPRAIIAELQPVDIEDDTTRRHLKEEEDLKRRQEALIESLDIDKDNILTPEQREQLKTLLQKHKDLFSTSDTDIGTCTKTKHRINLHDETPFKMRHRRIPPNMVEEVRAHLEQLLSCGIITPSKSPWASPVVLVRKKNGTLRMCIDFRNLNAKTIKDSYALPRIEDVFDCLQGAMYFSTLDMKSGYHQIEIEEEHKERTAFTVGALGFYHFRKMPFGLTNAPATFQRNSEEMLGDLNMKICVIYLDDLIIFSKTFEEHLHNINTIFDRLREFGLKLAPEKCEFFREKIAFLGHIVSSKGIETDPSKIDKIRNWPSPSTPEELRSFLSFAGYYRRFIQDFSKITRPLNDLLPPTKAKKGQKKPLKEWKWTDTEEDIFTNLKEILSTPPVLAYPDFNLPFEVHTDASGKGLGAVLYQQHHDNTKHVIAYASRSLSKSESNYAAFKLEFLALKWAVTEKFSDYLTNTHFTLLTDNNPLTYILTTAKLDATGQRWASDLGNYNFDIIYRAGRNNTDADALSRYPHHKIIDQQQHENIKIDNSTVKTICKYITPALIDTLPALSLNIIEATETPMQPIAQLELREIRKAQRQDQLIEKWRIATIDKTLPQFNTLPGDIIMKKNFENFIIKRGILYRNLHENEEIIEQLVIPNCYKREILEGFHDDCGHPGRDRTLRLLRERYFWPGITTDVEKHVTGCNRCLRRKTTVNTRAPMINVNTTYPLELVCFDFLSVEPSKGHSNILVITDHYTKFAMAIPTKNQTAKTTAEAFYNNFVVQYGIPTTLHSDQGANFESQIIKELCKLTNTKKTHTSIYHPQGNGTPERFNRTLLGMLGTLENDQKKHWTDYIKHLVFCYNCTPHESTRVSPFELMFGRKAKLPMDTKFEQVTSEFKTKETKDYIEHLKMRMKRTREIVEQYVENAKGKQKKYYDMKARAARVQVGDKVLVKILSHTEGKHKLVDKFEEEVFTVLEQVNDHIPVYRVRSESGKEKTLHRNHLRLLVNQDEAEEFRDNQETTSGNSIPVDVAEEEVEELSDKKTMDASKEVEKMEDDDEDESDAGDLVYFSRGGDAHILADDIDMSREESRTENIDMSTEESRIEDRDDISSEVPGEQRNEDREELIQAEDRVDDVVEDVPESTAGNEEENNEEEMPENVPHQVDLSQEADITEEPDITEYPIQDQDNNNQEEIEVPIEMDEAQPIRTETSTSDTRAPTPKPRQSVRERRPPDRYKDYQMNACVVPRPQDARFEALNKLIASGVLNQLDSKTAGRMVSSIFQ
jgi:hypothetical protein